MLRLAAAVVPPAAAAFAADSAAEHVWITRASEGLDVFRLAIARRVASSAGEERGSRRSASE
jgi:hypothetical protein